MTTRNENETDSRQFHANVDSDDEHVVNERTSLLNSQERIDGSDNADLAKGDDERRRWPSFFKWNKRDVGYALLFSIPVLLFIPALVFFVLTLNLRASLPPSSSLETINNLTHRVDHLSKSLSTCNANSTRLSIQLHDERQRVAVCRESEKRLAERVDVVEEMLDSCKSHEAALKEELNDAKAGLDGCIDEREELKRQMESGVFVQFLNMVSKMGTGGDSWVCSDLTQSWSYGYSSTESPHPTVTIQTWTAQLNDVQHSAVPLVFPPDPAAETPDSPPSPIQTGPQSQLRRPITSEHQPSGIKPLQDNFRVIGYNVVSQNTSGSNGWWRIAKLPAFAIQGRTIEFYAQAAKWYGSTARFDVTVYWVSTA